MSTNDKADLTLLCGSSHVKDKIKKKKKMTVTCLIDFKGEVKDTE